MEAKLQHQEDPENLDSSTKYNEAKSTLDKLIKQESFTNWKSFCSELKNVKQLSKLCKALGGSTSPKLTSLRKPDGSYTSNPKETLELLTQTLYSQPQPQHLTPVPNNLTQDQINSIISHNRLDEAINNLQRNKSPGPDKISNDMLIEAYEIIKLPLLNIFKLSLHLAKIPLSWQLSDAAILSKPGKSDYFTAKSFRIITLSPSTLKVMERLILWHLNRDLQLDNALSSKQYGFRKGNSTESAIIKLVSLVESALKLGNYALGIFLDIEGAFDNIPFSAIKNALEKTAAKGNISNWILHFITNRKLKLKLQSISIIIWILAGCPQGGVLSPFLWNLVLDSLFLLLSTLSSLLGFADDLAIILLGFCLSTLRDLGQSYLKACDNWCKDHGLKISSLKTQIIIFSRKHKIDIPRPIKLNGIEIDFCNTIKYLGINLDKRLNWHHHINVTTRKCTTILFAARKTIGKNWGISPDKIIWVYNAIIKPIITYACVTWAPRIINTKSNMKPLDKLGNLTLLLTSGALKSTSQDALHYLFQILPISLELEQTSLLQAIKLMSLNHWPTIQPDNSVRKSFIPCHTIINKTLDNIFNPYNRHTNDLDKPTDISHKHFTTSIHGRDITPQTPGPHTITCYTDGSKHSDGSTGSGVVIYTDQYPQPTTESTTLSPINTVFQCEAYALNRAGLLLTDLTRNDPNFTEHRIIIYTDSQALIKALNSDFTSSKTITKLHTTLNNLSSRNHTFIEWIPGHEGHEGNELADRLANIRQPLTPPTGTTNNNNTIDPPHSTLATLQTLDPPPPSTNNDLTMHIPFSHFKQSIKTFITNKHKDRWNAATISNNTKSIINPIVHHQLHSNLLKLESTELKQLTRLVTGHNNLNNFQNKINRNISPYCRLCEEQVNETPTHLLCSCPKLAQLRMNEFGEHPTTIEHICRLYKLTKRNPKHLLKFIDDLHI